MASEKLFWQHPAGDTTTIPCTHFVKQHPNGDKKTIPCTHGLVQEHPGGDTIKVGIISKNVPCTHMVPKHSGGDTVTIPCTHVGLQHPNGDPGPTIPCIHPLSPVRLEMNGGLIFYTNDSAIQNGAIAAVNRLRSLGVNLIAPRPLNVFNRNPIGNGDNTDPFWHRYHSDTHSIQVMRNNNNNDSVERLHHEMGHALLGHNIVNHYADGPHGLTQVVDQTLAMSEGWADFVALIIEKTDSDVAPTYQGMNWENMSISPNPNIEYCVGSCLWDLWDKGAEGGLAPDNLSLPFTELFKVYSPTLQTLPNGPIVRSIGDFISRLKKNNPDKNLHRKIDDIKLRNVGN